MTFVIFDGGGKLNMIFEGRAVDAHLNKTDDGFVFDLLNFPEFSDEQDAFKLYVNSGELTLRPSLSVPSQKSLNIMEDWQIDDIPSGTEVELDGEVFGTTDETGLILNFSAYGIWQVTLRPPFPWIEASCEVTVT